MFRFFNGKNSFPGKYIAEVNSMKLMTALLLVFYCFAAVTVDAKDLLTIPGAMNDDDLNIPKNQIVDNNTDWSKSGNYRIRYYDSLTKQVEEEQVFVLDKETLVNGWDYSTAGSIYLDAGIKVRKILYYRDSEFFLIGEKKISLYQTQDEQVIPYVAFYQDQVLKWSRSYNENHYGTFRDAVLTDRGISLIGDTDTDSNMRNAFILELSPEGSILYSIEPKGSRTEYGKRIFYDRGRLYFLLTTQSQDQDFLGFSHGDWQIAAGMIDPATEERSLLSIGNSENDLLLDAVYANQKMYLYLEIAGSGYFSLNTNIDRYRAILSVDDRLELGHWISADDYELGQSQKLIFLNGFVTLVTGKYLAGEKKLYRFHPNLDDERSISLNFGNVQIRDFTYSSSGSLMLLDEESEKGEYQTQLVRINELYHPEFLKTIPGMGTAVFVYQSPDTRILYGIGYGNKLEIRNHTRYQLKENIREQSDRIFYENILCANSVPLQYQLAENNVGPNPYGMYTNLYAFEDQNLKMLIPMNVYFPATVNVTAQGVYDLGVKLKFNGQGKLNGIPIENGYQISNPGNYVLEIVGTGGETRALAFSVKQISENAVPEEELAPYEFQLGGAREPEANYTPYREIIPLKQEAKSDPGMMIVIGSSILGILMGILLRPGKKAKADD